MNKERRLYKDLRNEFGPRSLADARIKGQKPAVKAENLLQSELNSSINEMRRAGMSDDQIKLESRVETILALGKRSIISPCDNCPKRNAEILCTDRDSIQLSARGSLLCPDGRGVISLLSGGK